MIERPTKLDAFAALFEPENGWADRETMIEAFDRFEAERAGRATMRTFEQGYVEGQRTSLLGLVEEILVRLRIDTTVARVVQLEAERAEVVSTLRGLCEDHGDNEWPDDLHLVDVIENHLERRS